MFRRMPYNPYNVRFTEQRTMYASPGLVTTHCAGCHHIQEPRSSTYTSSTTISITNIVSNIVGAQNKRLPPYVLHWYARDGAGSFSPTSTSTAREPGETSARAAKGLGSRGISIPCWLRVPGACPEAGSNGFWLRVIPLAQCATVPNSTSKRQRTYCSQLPTYESKAYVL